MSVFWCQYWLHVCLTLWAVLLNKRISLKSIQVVWPINETSWPSEKGTDLIIAGLGLIVLLIQWSDHMKYIHSVKPTGLEYLKKKTFQHNSHNGANFALASSILKIRDSGKTTDSKASNVSLLQWSFLYKLYINHPWCLSPSKQGQKQR